jgi:hypothetical protein
MSQPQSVARTRTLQESIDDGHKVVSEIEAAIHRLWGVLGAAEPCENDAGASAPSLGLRESADRLVIRLHSLARDVRAVSAQIVDPPNVEDFAKFQQGVGYTDPLRPYLGKSTLG